MSRKFFRRGNYSVIAAAGLPVLLGFAAIVIDASRAQIARHEVNMAAESIAHSALISMKKGDSETVIRKKAQVTGQENDVDGDLVNIKENKHIHFGNWDFDTKTWTPSKKSFNSVKVIYGRTDDHREGPLDMMLMPFMGTDYMDISENTATVAAFRPRDLCLVMDVTASFAGEMPEAKKAALSLLQTMHDQYLTGDQVCMVVFVGDSRVFTSLADIQDDYADIKSQWDGTRWGVSGKVTGEDQWYYQNPGKYWGWTGRYVNVWDGTYNTIVDPANPTKKETRTREVFSHYDYEPYIVKEEYEATESYEVDVDKTRQVAVYKRNEVVGKEEYTATKNVPYYRRWEDSGKTEVATGSREVSKYKRYEDSGKTKQEERTRKVDLYKREEDSGKTRTETKTRQIPVYQRLEDSGKTKKVEKERSVPYWKREEVDRYEKATRTEEYLVRRDPVYHYERRVKTGEKPEVQDQSYIEVLTPVLKYQNWKVTGQKDVQVDQNFWERADRTYQHKQLQKVGTKQELTDDYRYETRDRAYDSYRWDKTGRKVPEVRDRWIREVRSKKFNYFNWDKTGKKIPEVRDNWIRETRVDNMDTYRWEDTGKTRPETRDNYELEKRSAAYDTYRWEKTGKTKPETRNNYRLEKRSAAYDTYRWEKTGKTKPETRNNFKLERRSPTYDTYRWKPTGRKLERTRDRWIKQTRSLNYAYERYLKTGTRPEQRTRYTREVRDKLYRYEQLTNVTKTRQVPNWKLYYQTRTDNYKERVYTLQKSETRYNWQRYYRTKNTTYREATYTLQRSETRYNWQRYYRVKSTTYQERVYTLNRSETRYRNFKRYYRRIYNSYREREYYKTETIGQYCYYSYWYGNRCYSSNSTCQRYAGRWYRCRYQTTTSTRTSRYYFSGASVRYKTVSYCDTRNSWCSKSTTYGPWTRSYYSCSSNSTWTSGSYQYKCEGERYTHTWTETSNYYNGGTLSYKNVSYCDTRNSWCTSRTVYGPWTKSSYSCSSKYTYDTYKCEGTPYTYSWTETSRYNNGGKVSYKNVSYCDTRNSWCTSKTTYGPWTKSSYSCSSSYTYDTYKCVGTPYTYTWNVESRYSTGGKIIATNYRPISSCDTRYDWCSMTTTWGSLRASSYTCKNTWGESSYSKRLHSNGYYYTCRQEGMKTESYTVAEWKPVSYCNSYYSTCKRYDNGYSSWRVSGSCSYSYSNSTSRCRASIYTAYVDVYGWVNSSRPCTWDEYYYYGTCRWTTSYSAWKDSGTCSGSYSYTYEKCINRPETYYVDEYAWAKDSGTCTSAQIKAKQCELRPNGGYTAWTNAGTCTSAYSRTTERCKNYPYTVQVPIYDWFKRSGGCTAAQLASKECELRRNGYTAWADAGKCSSVYNRDMERCKNYPYTVQVPIYDWFKRSGGCTAAQLASKECELRRNGYTAWTKAGKCTSTYTKDMERCKNYPYTVQIPIFDWFKRSGTCTPAQLKAKQCELRKNGYTAWTKSGTCSAASSATYVRCYNKPITVMVDEFGWIPTTSVCSKPDRLAGKCKEERDGWNAWVKSGTCTSTLTTDTERCYNDPETVMVDEYGWLKSSKPCESWESKKKCELRWSGGYTAWSDKGSCTTLKSDITTRCVNRPKYVTVPVMGWVDVKFCILSSTCKKEQVSVRWYEDATCEYAYSLDPNCRGPKVRKVWTKKDVYGWVDSSTACNTARPDCQQVHDKDVWVEMAKCPHTGPDAKTKCQTKTRKVTVMIPIYKWNKIAGTCTPGVDCKKVTTYEWNEVKTGCLKGELCEKRTREVIYDKPIMKTVEYTYEVKGGTKFYKTEKYFVDEPIMHMVEYNKPVTGGKFVRYDTETYEIEVPIMVTVEYRTQVPRSVYSRTIEEKYMVDVPVMHWVQYDSQVPGSIFSHKETESYKYDKPIYHWVEYDSKVPGSEKAGERVVKYTATRDKYDWVEHATKVEGSVFSHNVTQKYTEKETRTRTVTKIREVTKYNEVEVKKTETYTVDVPNYIQVKNYISQKEYDWIIITGGVAWGKTNFTKDFGLSWCDSRCGYSTIKAGKMYAANKCSESYAADLWHTVWGDPSIRADIQKYNPGADAEHWAVQMPNCGVGGGNTNQGTGLDAAIDEILTNGSSGSMRHIALVSDGSPTTPAPYWVSAYGKANTLSYNSANWGVYQANQAWDNYDMSISTVSFNNATNMKSKAAQSAYLKSLVRGHGNFYETPTATELVVLMNNIANNMEVVLVQ